MTECSCGGTHHKGANYYTSVTDAGQVGLLTGPYDNHPAALADVPAVRAIAETVNSRAVFYAFGTIAMKPSYTEPGLFNKQGLWPPKPEEPPVKKKKPKRIEAYRHTA